LIRRHKASFSFAFAAHVRYTICALMATELILNHLSDTLTTKQPPAGTVQIAQETERKVTPNLSAPATKSE